MPSKVLLLGDMLELGEDSISEHMNILLLAKERGFERLFLVGSEFALAYDSLDGKMSGVDVRLFPDSLVLQQWLKENPLNGSSVLVKGSRGKRLERVLEVL
jgi:UDP-N-acetylmuramoyl-tripeptide--D-alanyl-D-alanine ligase